MTLRSFRRSLICLSVAASAFLLCLFPTGVRFLWQLTMLIAALFGLYFSGDPAAERFHRLRGPVRILKKIFWICFFLCLCAFIAVETLIISHSSTDRDIPQVDYILVLGAGVNGEEMSLILSQRVSAAYDFWQTCPDAVLVLCGGQGPGESISEAECMARWFRAKGVPEEQLILEDQSTDTAENIANARQLISLQTDEADDPLPVAVVTNGFHLYRAKTLAKMQNFVPYGVSAKLPWRPFFRLNYYTREFVGVILMWLENL